MEAPAIRELADELLARWNAHDVDGVAALCSEDVVFVDPALPQPAIGRRAMRDTVASALVAFPDFRLERIGDPLIAADEGLVLVRFRMIGTMKGHWGAANVAATGRSLDIRGIDEWLVSDGLLRSCVAHYDSTEAARQLGMLPPETGLMNRAMLRMQHVQAWFQRRSSR
ncbi:MAG TPA: nuclear transport factor 2 family protein [Thermoleophilaceae bacterium]|jgi:steroid delta-isomerase-like uncharacterized protein